jgi:hypothetical protein
MSSNPYISFIACSRNDNHGGDLTRRMQIFVDCLSEQCDRHKLRAELVLVEWNPPPDRRPLAEELRWRKSDGFCDVRIITVPPEIHKRYKCAEGLPLFQMIAKNVGIRRARGEFILCTNIDIVFSDELMDFLAKKELAAGCFYRSIRMDADEKVPEGKPVSEVLEYCKNHVIRANLPRYSFEFPSQDELSKSGVIRSPDLSISNGGDFIRFHEHGSVLFAGTGTQILLDPSQKKPLSGNVLVLEVATTNQESESSLEIEFLDKNGELVYEASLSGRKTIAFEAPVNAKVLTLICRGASEKISNNQKLLPLCILELGWINHIPFESVDYDCYNVGDSIHILGDVQSPQVRYGGRRGISRKVQGKVFIQLPARARKQKLVFLANDEQGKQIDSKPVIKFNGTEILESELFLTGHLLATLPECSTQNYVEISFPANGAWYLTDVHVTEHLLKDCFYAASASILRLLTPKKSVESGQPGKVIPNRFELLPLNLDTHVVDGIEVCASGKTARFVAKNPIPVTKRVSFEILPGFLAGGEVSAVVARINGKEFFRTKEKIFPRLDIPLPEMKSQDSLEIEFESNSVRKEFLKDRGLSALNYYAFFTKICWLENSKERLKSRRHSSPLWFTLPDATDCSSVRNPLDFNCHDLPRLFFNACGDFTLAAKEVYFKVGGYAEFEIYSMHLDSLFLYSCYFEGFTEKILPENMVHYHIEHGGGWTPEGHEKLYRGLASRKVGWLGYYHDLIRLALTMNRMGRPLYFNSSDWGLSEEKLVETMIK